MNNKEDRLISKIREYKDKEGQFQFYNLTANDRKLLQDTGALRVASLVDNAVYDLRAESLDNFPDQMEVTVDKLPVHLEETLWHSGLDKLTLLKFLNVDTAYDVSLMSVIDKPKESLYDKIVNYLKKTSDESN